jgi:dTDP-4-amino-4,6-dideoxygalactose transaminase
MRLRYAEQRISAEDMEAVMSVLRSRHLTRGDVTERFERALADYCGAKYAVACSSGTAALTMAYEVARLWLPAMNSGRRNEVVTLALGKKARRSRADEWPHLIVPEITFAATSLAAYPYIYRVCCDVDADGLMPADFGSGIDWVSREWSILAPVHLAGMPIDPGGWIADGMCVIEDAAHSFGARYSDGSPVGSKPVFATCLSFHPVKPITTGEGGAVITNHDDVATLCRQLRNCGRNAEGLCETYGWNFHMSEMQAALGLSQMRKAEQRRQYRAMLAQQYDAELPVAVTKPPLVAGSAWHLYCARFRDRATRDRVWKALADNGVETNVHYRALGEHPLFEHEVPPNAARWSATELSLPLHAGMFPSDVAWVCHIVAGALEPSE